MTSRDWKNSWPDMAIVIFITCKDKTQAKKISSALVGEKLAACVNIVSNVESLFWWGGKVDSSPEILLIVKSKKTHLSKIIKRVKSLHSYKLPEIIALPIAAGEREYLKWLEDSVK